MRKALVFAILLGLSALVAIAQDTPVIGKVTVIDPTGETITVVTSSGKTIVYRVNTDTTLTSAGQTTTLDQVQVGNRVKVYHTGQGSDQTVTSLDVMPSGSTTGAYSPDQQQGRLPKTASSAPLVGALGVMFLLTFAAVRSTRRPKY